MKVRVQVVTLSEDGRESRREVACVERADLTPATLGLSLAACRRELFDRRLRHIVHLAHEQKIQNRRLRSNP